MAIPEPIGSVSICNFNYKYSAGRKSGACQHSAAHPATGAQKPTSRAPLRACLSRHEKDLRKAQGRCEAGERSACRLAKWQAFLSEISSAPLSDQLYRVNRYINHVRYRTDERNWDRADFWAVPEQFFARGGDCEDYAIAKYVSLRSLGIPAERLRVVVVYDRKIREDHAVLVITAPDGIKVLDSNRKRVIDWEEARKRYSPYYSVNEQAVWIHNSKA